MPLGGDMNIDEKIEMLEKKISYLTTLFENHIMIKEDAAKENKDKMLGILKDMPLAKHPMFKAVIDAFEKSMSGEKP